MGTTGYFKVCGTSEIVRRHDVDGEAVAATGYIRWQEFFFFDGQSVGSVKSAYESASALASDARGRLSLSGAPGHGVSGPWSDVPRVGDFSAPASIRGAA